MPMKEHSTSDSPWSDPNPESSDTGDSDLQHPGNDEEHQQPQDSSTDDSGSSELNTDPDEPEAGIHDLTRIANNIVDGCPEILDLARNQSPETPSSALQGETSKMIGPYKVLEFISRGGFGDVYLCQETCKPHRKLAVKVIRAGLDTKDVLARFEAEKNALRLMNHAAISRIIDSGATEDDHPYFAMEYIKGQTLTEYCSNEQLTLDERLRLFIDICSGVQHAHAKSVIHRDLKPSNIMVTRIDGVTRAKIIDFGLVKSLQQPLCEQTLHTRNGALIGTYEYMSPEQARSEGAEIDTRSDIYALGAILYQLLTGEMALGGLRKCSYAEALDRISREEPIRPSLRIRSDVESATSDHASTLKIGTEQLTQRLEVDLDWVVMKALEKEPERRYQTVQEFARDIENFLSGEMVEARPPSTSYRLNKFARRNRVVLTATALVILSLSAVFTWALMERSNAHAATKIAEERAEDFESVVQILLRQLGGIDLWMVALHLREDIMAGIRATHVKAGLAGQALEDRVLDLEHGLNIDWIEIAKKLVMENYFEPALAAIDKDFSGHPRVRARLLERVALELKRLGLHKLAALPQEEALTIRRTILGSDDRITLKSIQNMGSLLSDWGKRDEAMAFQQEALEGYRRVLGDNHRRTLASINNMGVLLQGQSRLAEAMTFTQEALDGYRQLLGDDDPSTLRSFHNMGSLLKDMGKPDEAMPFYQEALAGRRLVLGNDHQATLRTINSMGALIKSQGDLDEAMPLYQEALESRRRVLGNYHPDTLRSINNMGTLLLLLNREDEARTYFQEALEGRRRVLGNDHRSTLRSIYNMGVLLQEQNKPDEAILFYQEALDGYRTVLGTDHADTLRAIKSMGALLQRQGRQDEAIQFYEELLDSNRRMLGNDDPETLRSIKKIGLLLKGQGKLDEAMPFYQVELDGYRRIRGNDDPCTLRSINDMGALLQDQGKLAAAFPFFQEALEGRRRMLGNDHRSTLLSIHNMGSLARERGRLDEADALSSEAVAGARLKFLDGDRHLGIYLIGRSMTLVALGRFEDAQGPALEGHSILDIRFGATHKRSQKAIHNLIDLYDGWHKTDPAARHDKSAAEWQAKLDALRVAQVPVGFLPHLPGKPLLFTPSAPFSRIPVDGIHGYAFQEGNGLLEAARAQRAAGDSARQAGV